MKFTPTALTLPLLAALLCLDSPADESDPITVTAVTSAEPARRLREDEINRLLERAEALFGNAPTSPLPVAEPEPPLEVHFSHPHVDVRCRYPRTDLKPLRAHMKDVFSHAGEVYQEYLEDFEDTLPATSSWEYLESWAVSSRTERMVSLSCSGSSYSGGAHSNAFHRGVTFVLDGDRAVEIRLANLFNPCALWLNELSERTLAQLRAAEASLVVSGEIRFMDERRLDCWSLTPEGIEFLFPPCDVGCCAEGSFTALVRYEDIRGLLNPIGPAAEFLH